MSVWPCLREARLGGWILRFSNGLYGRSNSVQPFGDPGYSIEAAVEQCESVYREEALPPMFRIPELGPWQELDALLERRGYVVAAPTLVCTASISDFAPTGDVELGCDPTELWLSAYCELNARAPGRESTVRELFARVPEPRYFAQIDGAAGPAAIGMTAVRARTGWIFGMATRESCRNRGFATRILAALLAWARTNGAKQAALQVQADNAPAVALYQKFDFSIAYRYHYRRLG
jgi:GNAT superfamily N-acetyltransferase